jgi:hypothetical protein
MRRSTIFWTGSVGSIGADDIKADLEATGYGAVDRFKET